ncbi:MAG TPA: hypothetical protein VK789_18860 [Bryobacteraceae bacterium]|nr:hypothetical protein [Bryobacteraceae bacterium]
MKTQILAALGEAELGLAAQVSAALAANDRAKYYFALLQMAMARADHPELPSSNLRQERLACGIEAPELDDVVGSTRREGACYRMPGCAKILNSVTQELRTMAAPVLEGPFPRRLKALVAQLPVLDDGLIGGASIHAITRAGEGKQDSIHQLVMDLHKRLNAMQAELAEERIDGASVYRIDKTDRPLVAAFMAGLNRTAPLKFDHPGLDTTATRAGEKLVIQNDIGTTDAHVIVIHVEGMTVRVTYTDVHAERAEFFRDMLKRFDVSWGENRAGQLKDAEDDANFTMLTGAFEANNPRQLEEYLNFLGSRLVFLIDWNRARKQLRSLLTNKDRMAVLQWAAEAEVGHRGFLELGGAQIINQAIEKVSGSAIHFGDRLSDALGNEAATRFVESVFRAATEGLKEHQSLGLIHDRVRAELQAYFASEGQRLLQLAGEHAGIIFELAAQVRDGVRAIGFEDDARVCENAAPRARAFEHDADQLVIAARDAVRRRPEYAVLFQVVERADDAADELEDIAFLLGLLKATKPCGEALDALNALGRLLVDSAQEWIKALGHAVHVKRAGREEDAGDFLMAIDHLIALEHQADDAERRLTRASVETARDFRQLHLYAEIGACMERAADALKGAALLARDHLFASVLEA